MKDKVLKLFRDNNSSFDIQDILGISIKEVYHYINQFEENKRAERRRSYES